MSLCLFDRERKTHEYLTSQIIHRFHNQPQKDKHQTQQTLDKQILNTTNTRHNKLQTFDTTSVSYVSFCPCQVIIYLWSVIIPLGNYLGVHKIIITRKLLMFNFLIRSKKKVHIFYFYIFYSLIKHLYADFIKIIKSAVKFELVMYKLLFQ